MNGKNLLILGAGAVAVFLLMRKKRMVSAMTFGLEKLGIDIRNKAIKIGLAANNPTGATATIQSINGTLFLNGKQIATIDSFQRSTIAPNSKSIINLNLRPTLTGVWSIIKDLIRSKGKDAKALKPIFEGSANVDGINFPIKTQLA